MESDEIRNYEQDKKLEKYKSDLNYLQARFRAFIDIGKTYMNFMFLFNGAAAVALIADIPDNPNQKLIYSIGFFGLGIITTLVGGAIFYRKLFSFYDQVMKQESLTIDGMKYGTLFSNTFNRLLIFLMCLNIFLLILGSIYAIKGLLE